MPGRIREPRKKSDTNVQSAVIQRRERYQYYSNPLPNMDGESLVFQGIPYVKGQASGRLIASNTDLSFWGGVDPTTGEIIDRHHELSGQILKDKILAIPGGRGSCTGSGVVLELLLHGNGPSAILFERREDIITLGVIIAEEMFGKAIPVVNLPRDAFQKVLSMKGHHLHIIDGLVSTTKVKNNHITETGILQQAVLPEAVSNVSLSEHDKALLGGGYGEAARLAMQIVLRMSDLLGASELMNIKQVHVDGCVYTGSGCLLFAQKLRDCGGKVQVPTSLNSISVDQRRWRDQGIDVGFGEAASKLADAYVDMGARPTFSCAPYQLATAPNLGDQIAWAESNAVVYANSVLGARTMKYPDFLDICIALTGRAPKAGPHMDINRQASIIVRVEGMQRTEGIDDAFFPLLGYHIGGICRSEIPVVVGLDSVSPTKDDLKAFGAAFATTSAAPMFHMVGVTPEARTLHDAIGDRQDVRSVTIDISELNRCWDELNRADEKRAIDLVSLGNPHFSFAEIGQLAKLCRGRVKRKEVAIVVTCGRSAHGLAQQAGFVEELERFGVDFITDTCWCMITDPIIPVSENVIMTNSGKYAHYGPGLTGRSFRLGSLANCVEAACEGGIVEERPRWLLNRLHHPPSSSSSSWTEESSST